MADKNQAEFTPSTNDTYNLLEYVQRRDFVFVRDRPAMDHLIYRDYKYRKTLSTTDEKIQCPFAVSKTPFIKRKRTFAYKPDFPWQALFDPE